MFIAARAHRLQTEAAAGFHCPEGCLVADGDFRSQVPNLFKDFLYLHITLEGMAGDSLNAIQIRQTKALVITGPRSPSLTVPPRGFESTGRHFGDLFVPVTDAKRLRALRRSSGMR